MSTLFSQIMLAPPPLYIFTFILYIVLSTVFSICQIGAAFGPEDAIILPLVYCLSEYNLLFKFGLVNGHC